MSCQLDLQPFIWNLPSIMAGNTFPGFNIFSTDEPDGNDLARVVFELKTPAGVTVLTYDSDDEGITIIDAETWDFDVDQFTAPSNEAIYRYTVTATDSLGVVATIIKGILPVTEQ